MSNILIVPPKTIDQRQKIRLREQGVIVVEVTDPDKVKLITTSIEVPRGDLIMSSLSAISKSDGSRQKDFVDELLRRLLQNEKLK